MIRRAAGYLLDIVPVLLIGILHFIPILGWMFFGFLGTLWWLLRDINGASLGKSIVGSVVLTEDGRPSTPSQRIIRNVPLAIPAFLEIIPLLGLIIAPVTGVVILVLELSFLALTGRRLGDRIAGTDVFRRTPVTVPVSPGV